MSLYSNLTLVTQLLAQALTSATPGNLDELGELMNIGNTLDSNNVTPDVINTYLADASADVNSLLSVYYGIPLKKKADLETVLSADPQIAGTTLVVVEPDSFGPGDTIVVTDGVNRLDSCVVSVYGNVLTIADPVTVSFSASTTRVVRIKFPDPIPYIVTRIAAANIYDKYFAAQADPNVSNYGREFRSMARIKMEAVLAGAIVLTGQRRVGTVTQNPSLIKAYGLPQSWNDKPFKPDDPKGG